MVKELIPQEQEQTKPAELSNEAKFPVVVEPTYAKEAEPIKSEADKFFSVLDATLNQALETERTAVQAALSAKLLQMENALKAERFQMEALLRQHMEQFELSKN